MHSFCSMVEQGMLDASLRRQYIESKQGVRKCVSPDVGGCLWLGKKDYVAIFTGSAEGDTVLRLASGNNKFRHPVAMSTIDGGKARCGHG